MRTFSELASATDSLVELSTFRSILAAAKTAPLEAKSGWYPYDSLATWEAIVPLLESSFSPLQHALRMRPVVDVGCGDGDLAFFLAHLGCRVTAIDHRWSNFNLMRGVHALKQRLHANVRIIESNLDSDDAMPDDDYGLALLFGVLYHLRNPFFVLDKLARRTRYCLLSTRIAALTPRGLPMKDEALAYLLGSGEANNDSTNYWIFSETGLSRLVERTYWEVLGSTKRGCTTGSNPVSNAADERKFLFLRSLLRSLPAKLELLQGWHPPEPEGWCWVDNNFSMKVDLLEPDGAREFDLRFTLPVQLAEHLPVMLSCSANGIDLGERQYLSVGSHSYRVNLPVSLDRQAPLYLQFITKQRNHSGNSLGGRGLVVSWRNEVSGIDKPVNFWIS